MTGPTPSHGPSTRSQHISPQPSTSHNGSPVSNQRGWLEAELLEASRQLRWMSPIGEGQKLRDRLRIAELPLVSLPNIAPLPVWAAKRRTGWSYAVVVDYSSGEHHSALIYGNYYKGSLGDLERVPVRVHSSTKTSDIFFGKNSDSSKQLDRAMDDIVERGRGIILYLEQDGRGNGVVAQAKALHARYEFDSQGKIVERLHPESQAVLDHREAFNSAGFADGRDYSAGVAFLRKLGVRSIELIGQSATKAEALVRAGMTVIDPSSGLPMPEPTPTIVNGVCTLENNIILGTDTKLTENLLPSPEVLRARLKIEMEAHCRAIDTEVQTPWETVAHYRQLLTDAGKSIVMKLAVAPLPTEYGDWTMVYYGDLTTGEIHRALVFGNLRENSLGDGENLMTRIHSSCKTNEIFHAVNCECKAELKLAMKEIQKEGRGVILYLDQEGRGTGITGKLAQLRGMYEFDPNDPNRVTERMDPRTGHPVQTVQAYVDAGYPPEVRDFTAAVAMYTDLGIKSLVVLTNNPRKLSAIKDAGIPYTSKKIVVDASEVHDPETVRRELRDKARSLGHEITSGDLAASGFAVDITSSPMVLNHKLSQESELRAYKPT